MRLRGSGRARDTIVFFSADNGPHAEGGVDPAFFDASGGRRGAKRELYEGGIRVPMLAWAPGRIPAGRVDATPWAMWDWAPTALAWAGLPVPDDVDGLPLGAFLEGAAGPAERTLYWEFHDPDHVRRALRQGRLKLVVQEGRVELYDLEADPAETRDLAASRPEVVERLRAALDGAHRPDPRWPLD